MYQDVSELYFVTDNRDVIRRSWADTSLSKVRVVFVMGHSGDQEINEEVNHAWDVGWPTRGC